MLKRQQSNRIIIRKAFYFELLGAQVLSLASSLRASPDLTRAALLPERMSRRFSRCDSRVAFMQWLRDRMRTGARAHVTGERSSDGKSSSSPSRACNASGKWWKTVSHAAWNRVCAAVSDLCWDPREWETGENGSVRVGVMGRVDESMMVDEIQTGTNYSGSPSSWISRLIRSEKTSFSGSRSFKTKSAVRRDGSKRPTNALCPLTIHDYNGCVCGVTPLHCCLTCFASSPTCARVVYARRCYVSLMLEKRLLWEITGRISRR